MVSVYRKIFGNDSISVLASDPVYPDRKLYLIRIGGRSFPIPVQYKNYLKEEKDEKVVEIQKARGMRDFLFEDKILREDIISTLKKIFKLYGYIEIETPIIERFETLASKYNVGTEILKEVFKLKDQGGRDLALRFDLTVPLARVISENPNIKLPFKRFQIGEVFRDGPIKLGRYRSFIQCDVDIIGNKSVLADVEILKIALDSFKELKIDVEIKINNIKILDSIIEYCNIPIEKSQDVILSIDKVYKLGIEYVKKELSEKGISKDSIDKLLKIISSKGNNQRLIKEIEKFSPDSLKEIKEVLSYLPKLKFDISLARGLSYYTGNIFEVYAKKSNITSSLAGGGRYDKLLYNLTGRDLPSVGISFGLDVIVDLLKERKIKLEKTETKIFIIPIKTIKQSLEIASQLREQGINTDIDLADKGISKNLDYCNKLEIPYVIFVGEDELKKKKLKLRDMKTGKENLLTLNQTIKKLKK